MGCTVKHMKAFILVAALAGPVAAGDDGKGALELSSLSLEDLMNIEVTSVSKSRQRIGDAPAAIYVITQEDIRRSGLSSLPELLRLAPGVQVARVDSSTWAIGARGFNQQYQHALLVLMDGRTVYDPGSSGVYWIAQDYVLEDLDRIEVIRGPGATLWGANAVNGVINISTKSADQTQGILVSTLGSDSDQIGAVRYGGTIDDDTYYRVYAKYRNMGDFKTADDQDAGDAWQSLRGGFRLDRFASDKDLLTLESEGYGARGDHRYPVPLFTAPFAATASHSIQTDNYYILGRWTHTISDRSEFSFQAYYDYFTANDSGGEYSVHTADVDFQHRFALGERQEITWGAGARVQSDRGQPTDVLVWTPEHETLTTLNAFVQDDITVLEDRFHVILGTKLEWNSRTGVEYEPSIRAIWTPNERNTVWGAVSRAVRTPSGFEERANLTLATFPIGPDVGEMALIGNDDLDSEVLHAYELGYRFQPTRAISLDVATFFNTHRRLISAVAGTPVFVPSPPRLQFPLNMVNGMSGESYGVEAAATWHVSPDWRLTGSYTWLRLVMHDGDDFNRSLYEGGSPRNQAQLHSYYNLTRDLEFNASAYYTESMSLGNVPSILRVDLGLTWRPSSDLELTLGVQNLLDDRHAESSGMNGTTNVTEMPRTFYGQLVWRH